jgi:hypothetical protein
MAQVVIDMKTIKVQLLSPKPKTAVIKECLISMSNVLESAGVLECVDLIKGMIGQSD